MAKTQTDYDKLRDAFDAEKQPKVVPKKPTGRNTNEDKDFVERMKK